MLKLDEPVKHNWIIKYTILRSSDELETLAEGKIFDFIPNTDDNVKIDTIWYRVLSRTIDFDNSIIWIALTATK